MKKTFLILCIFFLSSTLILAQIKIGIGATGGIKMPSGDIADIWGNALGGSACLTLDISRTVQLSVGAGYYRSAVADKFIDDMSKMYSQKLDITWPLNVIPVFGGIKIFLLPGVVKPYIGADAGILYIKADKAIVKLGGQSSTVEGSDLNQTGFYFSGGGGIQFALGSGLILDVNAKYEGAAKDVKAATQNDPSNIKFIAINAGLLFGI